MKMKYFSHALLIFFFIASSHTKQMVFTVWGQEEMDSPLIEEVLASPTMIRLKKIDQSGPPFYFGLTPAFSRYDHCVGVWALLNRAHVSLEEQVAGLLHDASHTAFSHLADTLFGHDPVVHHCSYQDSIHEWFLEKMHVPAITQKYGISLHKLNPDRKEYTALERPLPHLCADRIQYNIHTGVLFKKITVEEAQQIVNDLCFKNDQWFFKTEELAKKFASLPLYFTQTFWGSEYNHIFYQFFSQIVREAFNDKLFSKDDFHFGTDEEILEKIQQSSNSKIKMLLTKCADIYANFVVVPYGQGIYNHKPKFSGINPLVLTKHGLQSLREINIEFNQEFEKVQNWCKDGYGIRY